MDSHYLIFLKRKIADEETVGTAYPIAANKILTARHVVADDKDPVDISALTLIWWYKGKQETTVTAVAWDGLDYGLDAIVLETTLPDWCKASNDVIAKYPPILNDVWYGEAFPNAGNYEEGREPVQMKGTTFHGGEKNLQYDMQLNVDGDPLIAEYWMGASGSPVFLDKHSDIKKNQIVGLITDVPKKFEGKQLLAIPMQRLLKIDTFCETVGLPATNNTDTIDIHSFQKKITQELESNPCTVTRLDATEEKLRLDSCKTVKLPTTHSMADVWAYKLLKIPFDDAAELLLQAITFCNEENDIATKNSLLNIVFWLTPIAYDLDDAATLRTALKNDDMSLIEVGIATALAAEIQMASAGGRKAKFRKKLDKDTPYAGDDSIPLNVPHDIQYSLEDRLLIDIKHYLENKFFTKFVLPACADTQTIVANMERQKKRGNVLYLLFGGAARSWGLNKDQLRSLADVICRKYPPLAVLLLSDEVSVVRNESIKLEPIWTILEEANYHD